MRHSSWKRTELGSSLRNTLALIQTLQGERILPLHLDRCHPKGRKVLLYTENILFVILLPWLDATEPE